MARLGLGDVMAQRETLDQDGDGVKAAAETNGDGAKGTRKSRESDDEMLKKKVDAELDRLLDKGVKILRQSAPNLTWMRNQNGGGNGAGRPAARPAKAERK
jgi:hypothetical protein